MKLLEFHLRDFRGIKSLDLDFRDEFGLPRLVAPIVGPNTSGKTSILDAINLALGPITESYYLRPGLELKETSIVRCGAVQAKAECLVQFSDMEIQQARSLSKIIGGSSPVKIPETNEVRVHWEFPDLHQKSYPTGRSRCTPRDGWHLFKARRWIQKTLHTPQVTPRDYENAGAIFPFDQQRAGLAKRLTALSPAVVGLGPEFNEGDQGDRRDARSGEFTSDPRKILLNLATRAKAHQGKTATEREVFHRLCELYASVCRPHVIRGLFNSESDLDMEFEGPAGTYLYDGLSSGEQMILQLLLHFAEKRIHRSIVLIDELELHLHPLWQDRLYNALGLLGHDNQVVFTTHSSHLRKVIGEDVLKNTGDLLPAGVESTAVGV